MEDQPLAGKGLLSLTLFRIAMVHGDNTNQMVFSWSYYYF